MRQIIKVVIEVLVITMMVAQLLIGLYALSKPSTKPVQNIKIHHMQKSC